MISAPRGSTKPDAGVIATNPATAPEIIPSTLASKAPDLFERSNNAEKRLLIGFVFSNLTLEGPTLGYSLRKPFDLLVDLAKSQEWRPMLEALRTAHKGEVTSLYGRLSPTLT
jgi:hypothetical protein